MWGYPYHDVVAGLCATHPGSEPVPGELPDLPCRGLRGEEPYFSTTQKGMTVLMVLAAFLSHCGLQVLVHIGVGSYQSVFQRRSVSLGVGVSMRFRTLLRVPKDGVERLRHVSPKQYLVGFEPRGAASVCE